MNTKSKQSAAVLALLVLCSPAHALVVTDDFTQAIDAGDWSALGYACLTAGTSSNNNPSNSKIPGCNYSTPDAVGSGALRLTPAVTSQSGAIVSNYTFPSDQGLEVTFTSYTYGGNSGGMANAGADGISFFLMDGSVGTTVGGQTNLGALGGSLGYACSNHPTKKVRNGLVGAYLGLGIDEFGNFLRSYDNSATGITAGINSSSSNGYNSYYSSTDPEFQSNRIGLRGAGNVSWYWLNENYPSYYPSSLDAFVQNIAVRSTCMTGTLWNYAGATAQSIIGTPTVSGGTTMTVKVASVAGYNNGDSVSIGGTIMPAAQAISSVSNYNSGRVRVYVPNAGAFSGASKVNIIDATGSGSEFLNGTLRVQSIDTRRGYLELNVTGDPTSANVTNALIFADSPTVIGNYTISNLNAANNTFTVTLGRSVTGITNISGSVFNNTIGGVDTGTATPDYAAIPGGYWVLPDGELIANESAATRSTATPITYKLQISPDSLFTFMYSYNGGAYQSVLANWPITADNGPVPATFRFGFAGSTGASFNTHEITCFQAQPTQSTTGAGANTVQAGQVRTGTQVYLASYNNVKWTGSLVSDSIVNVGGTLSVSTVAEWDASCVLNGGACPNMGTTNGVANHTISVQSPSSRQLLTWNGATGIPLQWASLTATQQTVLDSSDSNGAMRLSWLRGERSEEALAIPAGPLRARSGVLGDIIDSSPTWIGPPSLNYGSQLFDTLYSSAGTESSYATFADDLATRLNVVYVGGNDGLLHGFRAGANNSDGTYNDSLNDGREMIGFMPSTALASSKVVDLTSASYGHEYFVDATPGYGDVYYDGAWHSWLVGGLGAGGKEIFVLDVTDPTGAVASGAAFLEPNASNIVVGDWTNSTLTTCVHASVNCGDNLGYTYGTPLVRRLHNGQWAIIFGNGYGSANLVAGVYVGLVDPSSGAITFYWLSTGSGSSISPNGIAYVSSADLDGDHVVDYLYAGDQLSNVWRFDLTSSDPADWAASTYGQPSAAPLFTTGFSGNPQPISTKIAVTATLTGGATRVLLGFGTGQMTQFTTSSPETYAPGAQSVYGIWDWDMDNWNNGTTTASSLVIPASSVTYASLAEDTSSPYRKFTRSDLLADSVALSTGLTRQVAISTVCWQDSLSCPGASQNTQYGWVFDLPDANEQVIYSPVFTGGALLVNTTVPPQAATVGQCVPVWPGGWSMAFDMASGGGTTQNVFPDANGNFVVTSGSSVVGIKQNAVGSPYIVSVGSKQYSVSQTVDSQPKITPLNLQGGVTVKRVLWEQLR